jgi:hypothetical protein
MVKNDEDDDDEMNEHFRSFSVLEEEKKNPIQMIDKKTKLSKTISDEDVISTEKSEEKVRLVINFLFLYKLIFSRRNHRLY